MQSNDSLTVLEICAGAGGQSLGLERAGFRHILAVDIDPYPCQTLRLNRPHWKVLTLDVHELNGKEYRGIDLLAGGVPCPPFSIAGHQRGADDPRDLFPEAIRLVEESMPRAVMLENVRGFATKRFAGYRTWLITRLQQLGYTVKWKVLNAALFGVPQLRPRFILVALRPQYAPFFRWPHPEEKTVTVAQAIGDLMLSRGWKAGQIWLKQAQRIAPTIVGGSKKHGGADLGPTRAKRQWAKLGINGHGIADEPPGPDFPEGALPKLTLRMVARLQGFPDSWQFAGGKTAIYRQIGNAFPPPVAHAVGKSIYQALTGKKHLEATPTKQLTLFVPSGVEDTEELPVEM